MTQKAAVRDDDLRGESFEKLKQEWLLRSEKKILLKSFGEVERVAEKDVEEKDVEDHDNKDIAKDELERDCYFNGSEFDFDSTSTLGLN